MLCLDGVGEHDEAREMHHRELLKGQEFVRRRVLTNHLEERSEAIRDVPVADDRGDDRKYLVRHQVPPKNEQVPGEYNDPVLPRVQASG
jgi:hypothetical protein